MEGIFERLLAETSIKVESHKNRLHSGLVEDWSEYQRVIGHLEGLEEILDVITTVKDELIEDND